MLAALLCCTLNVSAQAFFNLTAEQVKIDSLLPNFTYSRDLGYNYADSTYSVTIEYPEFVIMTDADVQRYKKITTATLPRLPKIDKYVCVSRKEGTLDISFVPLVFRDGKYQKLVSFKLDIKATANKAARSSLVNRAATAKDRYADHSVLSSGSWAKIRVPDNGVYQLTDALISQAGFSNPSKVKIYGYGGAMQPESLNGDYLTSTDDLKQVATCTVNGKRLFYANGPVSWTSGNDRVRNPYSQYGYYFLTENDEEAEMVDSTAFINSFYPAANDYNTLYEVEDYAWFHGGRNLYDSRKFVIGTANDYTVASTDGSATGTIRVVLTANSVKGTTATTAEISVNDVVVGTCTVPLRRDNYTVAERNNLTFKVSNLQASNKISITQKTGATMLLDYMVIHNDAPTAAPALQTASFAVPEYVYRITNQDHHADESVDMIILLPTTQKLRAQAERLKALHEQNDSMSVRIVPVDELYNEFSSGTPDATAYRRYLKMFYDRADDMSKAPKYLVLFGDGAWDNRMLISDWRGLSPDDFLLCYESEDSFSEINCFVADDFFCMLDDNELIQEPYNEAETIWRESKGKADVAVGRLPVRTEAQAKTMVDKIEAYISNKEAGAWQNTIVVMGDDGNGNIHMDCASDVAKQVEANHPSYDIKQIMWDAYKRVVSSTGNSYPEATNLIRQHISNGALIMNYSGHGTSYCLSHEQVIKIADFKDIASTKLPLWLTAACDVMAFDGQEENIGDAAIFNNKGGAIAFYGTTRTVYSNFNEAMNLAFMREVLNRQNGRVSIGEAARLAKNALISAGSSGGDITINKLQYTLLGDPALKLACPELNVKIDSINGVKTGGSGTVELKAGMKVVVDGHIEENGKEVTDFNGVMTATVSDAKREIVCRLNNTSKEDGASSPFIYYDRSGTVFKGSDSTRQGRFSFNFVVPKDISYNSGTGNICVYAVNSDKSKTAAGNNENFILNGSMDFKPDSIGPSVYCYLNSTAFSNGSVVNSTPYFMAEISDEDGINATGTGIGHDLQLIIDGDITKTYSLNDYFTFDFGSYTSGTLGYSIPQLSEGQHKLQFKSWDILNNSSTAELAFTVSKDVEPQLFDVECTKNPATTSTSFRIIHDRIGCEMDVVLDIFDMSGRHLWTYSETDVPTDNTLSIDWDLTVNGGRRLSTGVYLYRTRIKCGDSSYASKAKKLIILNNK